MLIITRNALWQQARALAQFHQNNDHLRVAVVDVNQIFNEFSSGNNDITAVRGFLLKCFTVELPEILPICPNIYYLLAMKTNIITKHWEIFYCQRIRVIKPTDH